MTRFRLLAAALFLAASLPAQIVLNEIAPSNLGLIADQDGDFSDWLELFNAGFSTENLEGYTLSDGSNPKQWTLPALALDPGQRLLVFASGKDRRTLPAGTPNHWETALAEGDDWQYFVGTEEPSSKWNQLSFNAVANWTTAPGPFGYGDDDDVTLVPAGTLAVYFRQDFEVPDALKITRAILSMDYDDGFVAYLNGTEIARSTNVAGTPSHASTTTTDHEAAMFEGGNPESFPIDPMLLAANLRDGQNVLAIELHNVGSGSSDLSGRAWLHFGVADATVFFPKPNPAWFVVDANAGLELHTNFKINGTESIRLFAPTGALLDSISVAELQPGHVRARISDGDTWCFSDAPTPGEANAGVCYKGYAPTPALSAVSGFYADNQSVVLSGATNIRFTLDGNVPVDTSEKFAQPIVFDKTGVLRARAFQPQKLPSAVATATYFIGEPTTLPVVSITTQPGDFFNDGSGGPAIYDNKTGKAPVRVEFFDAARSLVFSENASARVVGNYSVEFAQKSLQFEFSSDYGATSEMPNIFKKDKPDIASLHGFRIRNMDDDWNYARMRDVLSNRMSLPTHCASAGYENVATFINGQYWGHYAAREMLNGWYARDNFGANPDSVDIITTQFAAGNPYEASEGTSADFLAMSDFVIGNSMASAANWARADSMLDWQNWADYFATEIYIGNGDWFSSMYFNNTRLLRVPGQRWRFVLWDTNYSQTNPDYNLLHEALAAPAQQNRYTDMMNSLLANTTFKNYFVNRFADLLNEHFNTLKINALIDENAAQLAPEINAHNNAWGGGDLADWQSDVDNLKAFHAQRAVPVRNHIQNHFGLSGKSNVTLKVEPTGAGRIQISTLTLDEADLPWTGVYFRGNPVKITAIAEPGYTFAGWSPNPFIVDPTSEDFTANIMANSTFTANFTGTAAATDIVVSEINYHSDSLLNSGDWFEIWNHGSTSINLTGWSVTDSDPTHKWNFPSGTTLAANGRLVLFSDATKFSAVHPSVTNKLGTLPFSLSNSSDSIVLKNAQQANYLIVRYKDGSKWPCTADGYGRTLELSDPAADPNEPESWFAGCIGGSPGKAYTACAESPAISEINYNSAMSADAGDWFEIWNSSNATLNLSNWVVRDGNDAHFYKLPANTNLPAGGRLVVFEDQTKFLQQHPAVANRVGPLGFSLANSGDVLRLYDATGAMRHSICFQDTLPWAIEADGLGRTLEWNGQQPNLSTAWFAGCLGGSPGVAYDPNCGMSSTWEIAENARLAIAPNPAGATVGVKILGSDFSEKMAVRVFDALGRPVFWAENFENGAQIALDGWPSGWYRVVCQTAAGAAVGQFLKQ